MIDGLGPYPEYRESGLPWAPRVPGHWHIRRTKTVFAERVEKGFPNEPLLTATQSHGVIRKSDYGSRTVTATKDFHLLKLVERGDFVISLRSFEGGIEVAHHRGIISPAYTVLRPNVPESGRFFAHLLKSNPFVQGLQLFITGIREGQNIDYSRLARAGLPAPPPDEQAAIVRFLDHANRRIDGFIRAKRKLIALLNEQKQAIIHRAVTRGLDPSVQMKDSGVPWIGEIPAHWEVRRLKQVAPLQRGYDLPAESRVAGVYPVVSSGGPIGVHREFKCIGPGVVIGRYGSTDAVFYVESDFWPHNTALFVTDFHDNAPRWCYFLLRTISKGSISGKSAVPGVDRKDLHDIVVPVAPPLEQATIVRWLAASLAELDATLATVTHELALVREYRTRLISDVVTGQLDIRAAAASLPAEVPEPESVEDLDADFAADEDASDEEIDGDDP